MKVLMTANKSVAVSQNGQQPDDNQQQQQQQQKRTRTTSLQTRAATTAGETTLLLVGRCSTGLAALTTAAPAKAFWSSSSCMGTRRTMTALAFAPSQHVAQTLLMSSGTNTHMEKLSAPKSPMISMASSPTSRHDQQQQEEETLRIGIVGGGLAGITAAHALTVRAQQCSPNHNRPVDITVLESDPRSLEPSASCCHGGTVPSVNPAWKAAAARNANSIATGTAMHILSRPGTLSKVLKDTAREWWEERVTKSMERLKEGFTMSRGADRTLQNQSRQDQKHTQLVNSHTKPPPYFAFHLRCCLGWDITAAERWSFLRFGLAYLHATFVQSSAAADQRSAAMCQLAKANRAMYLQAVEKQRQRQQNRKQAKHEASFVDGHTAGFLAVYRSLPEAEQAVRAAAQYGERAELLPWEEAVKLEPRLSKVKTLVCSRISDSQHSEDRNNVAMTGQKLFVVHRLDDFTVSCEMFLHSLRQECIETGMVTYRTASVQSIQRVAVTQQQQKQRRQPSPSSNQNKSKNQAYRYRVILDTESGDKEPVPSSSSSASLPDFDVLILAAGARTPLLAADLSVGEACPTYPMRGFSMTRRTGALENNTQGKSNSPRSVVLNHPFSIDSLYCSSVTPNTVRWAGFGEFVGFPPEKRQVISMAPTVLQSYHAAIFGNVHHNKNENYLSVGSEAGESVLACYRPVSPDDLPLVGHVPQHSGLFLHTGHGTLGWTTCLATADCLAQAVFLFPEGGTMDGGTKMTTERDSNGVFELPDGSTMDSSILSPGRFLSR